MVAEVDLQQLLDSRDLFGMCADEFLKTNPADAKLPNDICFADVQIPVDEAMLDMRSVFWNMIVNGWDYLRFMHLDEQRELDAMCEEYRMYVLETVTEEVDLAEVEDLVDPEDAQIPLDLSDAEDVTSDPGIPRAGTLIRDIQRIHQRRKRSLGRNERGGTSPREERFYREVEEK